MSVVLVSGTPADGFRLIGLFTHPALAKEWAENWEEDIDWWILPIIEPNKLEQERMK